MSIPTDDDVRSFLDRLETETADDIESQWLEFKPWGSAKEDMKVAVEYAVGFANADGGVVVFGVADRSRVRAAAIHGARGYDLDIWRRGIYAGLSPNLAIEVSELTVPEGTGRLLVVRVPRGPAPPYGTSQGLYKRRVGKNNMPLDAAAFVRERVSTGAIDWSGLPAEHVSTEDLDPIEIERARAFLRRSAPDSDLLHVSDRDLLVGIGALRGGHVTHTGLLLFGREGVLHERCPQSQVHYVYQISETELARNDAYRVGLLKVLEGVEQAFTGPANPEQEVTIGLFKLRVAAFPISVVREAVLNAVTHRDYTHPGEVLIRHESRQLTITSPGGFIGGITPQNILRHEPVSRNKTLAEALMKLRLVEQAGIGRKRIFVPMLQYGKRTPMYESSSEQVTLRIFDGAFDTRVSGLVARLDREGCEIGLDALLVLTYLREHPYLDVYAARDLLQLPLEEAQGALHRLSMPRSGILELRGRTRAATYHLRKDIAKELLGKVAYTKARGIDPIRYAELVLQFVKDQESVTPAECRELLGLGESRSARTQISRLLKKWSGPAGFLRREGRAPRLRYALKTDVDET